MKHLISFLLAIIIIVALHLNYQENILKLDIQKSELKKEELELLKYFSEKGLSIAQAKKEKINANKLSKGILYDFVRADDKIKITIYDNSVIDDSIIDRLNGLNEVDAAFWYNEFIIIQLNTRNWHGSYSMPKIKRFLSKSVKSKKIEK